MEPFSVSFILSAYPYKSFSLKGKFCGAVVKKKCQLRKWNTRISAVTLILPLMPPPPLPCVDFVALTAFGFRLVLTECCFFNFVLNDITAMRSTITWFYTELKSTELVWRHTSKEQHDTVYLWYLLERSVWRCYMYITCCKWTLWTFFVFIWNFCHFNWSIQILDGA